MKRLVFVSFLVLGVLVAPAALAIVPSHDAEITDWDVSFNNPPNTSTLHDVTVEVTCPQGETFLGRVTMRTESGTTVFLGKIKGTCTGQPVTVHTFSEQTQPVACGTKEGLGGQVRFSDGTRLFLPKIHFTACV